MKSKFLLTWVPGFLFVDRNTRVYLYIVLKLEFVGGLRMCMPLFDCLFMTGAYRSECKIWPDHKAGSQDIRKQWKLHSKCGL